MLERLLCLVRRQHENRLRSEGGLAFLVCEYCGYRSAGWETGQPPTAKSRPDSLRLLFGDGDEGEWVDTSAIGAVSTHYSESFRLLFDA